MVSSYKRDTFQLRQVLYLPNTMQNFPAFSRYFLHLLAASVFLSTLAAAQPSQEMRVGWIGAMSGPVAKYGAWEAAQIALDEINAGGGIAGKRIKLIAEDGRCNSVAAVNVVQKLINIDRVKYIIGGHCSPESVPIAPYTTRAKVLQIVAISSSPKLTGAGPYLFRITGDIRSIIADLGAYVGSLPGTKRVAVLYEETDYAIPEAEALITQLTKYTSVTLVQKDTFLPGTTDFRTLLLKGKRAGADYLFIGAQAGDTFELAAAQLRQLHWPVQLLGNTVAGSAARKRGDDLLDGLLAVDSTIDPHNRKAVRLEAKLKERFGMDALPLGTLTAEAYDALFILKYAVEKCGPEVDQARRCLEELKDFEGAAGTLRFDKDHNGVRVYGVGRYALGVWRKLKP